MITVTDAAKEVLRTFDSPEGQILRLEPVSDRDLGLRFGPKQCDDQVVDCGGEAVLSISGEVSTVLDGATLDRLDTPKGTTFGIVQPGYAPLVL
ncbi:MAG: hypothetical protein M3281_00640 [Chloroflexota bacterium]|nr:hypothetical protein [Chloroflexota bacterium]